MNIIELLERKRGLTDTQADVADYILLHIDDVTEMTIGELARAAHCSASVIVQLCRRLGLDGYRQLRIEIARQTERKRMQALDVNPDKPFIEGNNTRDIANSIAVLSKQAVDATYASLSTASIRKAAHMLLKARKIVYYAMGDSLASLEVFTTLMPKIGITCLSGMLKGDNTSVAQFLDSRDVAILVTYSGVMFEEYDRPISLLRKKGVRCIVLTANKSLQEKLMPADCVLTLPEGETREIRLASFYSQACTRFALNCVYAEAFAQNYQSNVETWERLVQFDPEGQE